MSRALRFFGAVDASTWVLLLAIAARVCLWLRLDPTFGYDATAHMAYAELLWKGRFPYVGDTDLGHARSTGPHPPLFYGLAAALGALGLGPLSGGAVSVLSGSLRLFLGDRLLRRFLSPRARLYANVLHGFIPFALRIDVFYSNESLASTLAVAAVWAAVSRRGPFSSGGFLGAALLSKATAVCAIPGVLVAFVFDDGVRPRFDLGRWCGLLLAAFVAFWMFLPWSAENLRRHGLPYMTAYHPTIMSEAQTHPHLFRLPWYKKHKPEWYFPRLRYKDLSWPYSDNDPTAWNAIYLEAWGDYYNNLRPSRPGPLNANTKSLTNELFQTHVAFVHLGLVFVLALLAGTLGAARRLLRRETSRAELSLAAMGLCYLVVSVAFATNVPLDYHGALKASYALGAVIIGAAWTGQALDRLASKGRALAILVGVLVAAPVLLTLAQLWRW